MSGFVKSVAKIALPIAGAALGSVIPGVGTAIGGALGGAAAGAIGGGGVKGAIIGGVTGGIGGAMGGGGIIGAPAETIAWNQGGTTLLNAGSGVLGAATGGGLQALKSTVSNPINLIGLGNTVQGIAGADAALTASKQQTDAIKEATAEQRRALAKQSLLLKPYVDAGTGALDTLQTLNNPTAAAQIIQSDPLYTSLADDAERRLLANQAAKGKVGSGGTADALQSSLLSIGNNLLQQRIGNTQNLVNTGVNAATGTGNAILNTGANVSNLATEAGNARAAGTVGAYNAGANSYQNYINTMLALQGLNKTPVYAPSISL